MEYGDEDDDDIEETVKEPVNLKVLPASKPFWAV